MDIRDAVPSIKEEIVQTALGGFMASGSFWLGLERLFTIGYKDPLFLACIAFFVCGSVLMVVGARQGLRRVSRLERYLPENRAQKREFESVS